jgi:hypothetical protein
MKVRKPVEAMVIYSERLMSESIAGTQELHFPISLLVAFTSDSLLEPST